MEEYLNIYFMKEGLNLRYLTNFYTYLLAEKWKRLFIFLIYIFVASLLPYFIVALGLDYSNESQIRNFYGDGSILMLCVGIMLSYFSVFLGFKEKKDRSENEQNDIKDDNNLITSLLFIVYCIVAIQFYLCQTSNRGWTMITWIILGSSILFFLTLIMASYLHFREEITFADIQSFEDKRRVRKMGKDSEIVEQTEDGTKL